MSGHHDSNDRLLELLAAQQLGDLAPEERDELQELTQQLNIDPDQLPDHILGELLVMLDQQSSDQDQLPADLARRLETSGRAAIVSAAAPDSFRIPTDAPQQQSGSKLWGWMTTAAAVIAIGASIFAVSNYNKRKQATTQYESQLAALQTKIDNNNDLLQASRLAAEQTQQELEALQLTNDAQATRLAELDRSRLELADQLAEATSSLQNARDTIAMYETPLSPEQLAENRTKLLTVPDAVQIAWQPFDLPDAPAEQQGVRGDVVWSDDLQEGYIRFVGLKPNDPNVEQYQIWVIDERGLEQKVSGGIFNASAEGEIVVPITPGIDVGRVALFAITIEEPGGTWVPDLSRRVVVAPREEDG